MIIVSQNRNDIYNFNNVKSIDVIDNEVYITDDILANKGTLIGEYSSEERAKEVLEEIILASTIKQINGKSLSKDGFYMAMKCMEFNLYEMPEE